MKHRAGNYRGGNHPVDQVESYNQEDKMARGAAQISDCYSTSLINFSLQL